MNEVWSAKDVTAILVQAGAVGLCYFLINSFGRKVDRLHDAMIFLASTVVDHKARHGDETPPELPRPDVTQVFPAYSRRTTDKPREAKGGA